MGAWVKRRNTRNGSAGSDNTVANSLRVVVGNRLDVYTYGR